MSAPAFGGHSHYRNDLTTVEAFLAARHYARFFVFNLCDTYLSSDGALGNYSCDRFFGCMQRVPFEDHGPPLLSEMLQLCSEASRWCRQHRRNVVAVHCKGGKGRTGVMVLARWLSACCGCAECACMHACMHACACRVRVGTAARTYTHSRMRASWHVWIRRWLPCCYGRATGEAPKTHSSSLPCAAPTSLTPRARSRTRRTRMTRMPTATTPTSPPARARACRARRAHGRASVGAGQRGAPVRTRASTDQARYATSSTWRPCCMVR